MFVSLIPVSIHKSKELHLPQLYMNDINFRTNIHMISAFALMQHSMLYGNIVNALEQPVLNNFESTYVGEISRNVRRPPLFEHDM